jgi:hypothetical protein
MKHPLHIFFLFILVGWGSGATAQKGTPRISDHLHPETLQHPYLLFNHEEKEQMLEAIRHDRELSEIYEKQLLEAYRYLKMPKDYSLPEPGRESRYYAISTLRNFQFAHMRPALQLAFAYQLTGNPEYAGKAFFHAEMLCRIDTWTNPAHRFPQIYDRVWPHGVEDDQVVFSFDLTSARISTHLALVYDWIYDYMDKGQRDRIRGALLENSILRVRGNYEYHWWTSAHRCNWSGVCYSGLGMASLALLKEDPQLVDVVERCYEGVSLMLDELGVDGGWQEGRGYWAYGVGHSVWFMDAIKNQTEGSYNLFAHPKLKDHPVDFVLYTMPANFADGGAGPKGDSWFINKLIAETGSQTAAWYRDTFLEPGESIYDLIYREPGVKATEPEAKSKHFRTIDWAVMQSSFTSEQSMTIVCKAGKNDDPHHGHLDCGNFIISYMGNNFIRDHGSASYDDFYFSAERWDYPEASSKGHNVVFVNGEGQIPAKIKDEPWGEEPGTSIGAFFTSEKQDHVVMNHLENAYPREEMKSWQRKIVLEKPSIAVVIDKVGSDKHAEIRSRIHPGGTVTTHENYYTISSADEVKLAVVPFSDQPLEIETGRHGSLSANEKSTFEWIQYVDSYRKADQEQTIMGYLVFPFTSRQETDRVLKSVTLQQAAGDDDNLTFSFKGTQYNVPF